MPIRAASISAPGTGPALQPDFQLNDVDMGLAMGSADMMNGFFEGGSDPSLRSKQTLPHLLEPDGVSGGLGESISWEMLGLGLEEPLPSQDMMDELSVALDLTIVLVLIKFVGTISTLTKYIPQSQ